MKIAIIGAGPAGLISARNALKQGFDVTLFEKLSRVGGIWNPDSSGAYLNTHMQNSKDSFHYTSVGYEGHKEFLNIENVSDYLEKMASSEGILPITRFNTLITALNRNETGWLITSVNDNREQREEFDKVIITTGELWEPNQLECRGLNHFQGAVISSKEYQDPADFKGKRVLVVGGGVSGADIASDLVSSAKSVSLSVRKMGLYLPRSFDKASNDMIHSYLGRYLLSCETYEDFLSYLDNLLPDYMETYRKSGVLPKIANNNAVHVNEKIIPNIASGLIKVEKQIEQCLDDGSIQFIDSTTDRYDVIITCTGYEMPSYSFIDGFSHDRLYEHFFWCDDPTLTVINPPVDTAGFGAAFPYFDVISQWVLSVYSNKVALPSAESMGRWCEQNMQSLQSKRFYDSWLETIRLGIQSQVLPDPKVDFTTYWNIISSVVKPHFLISPPQQPEEGVMDGIFDFNQARIRILANFTQEELTQLAEKGQITQDDIDKALKILPMNKIPVLLTYSQKYLA